MGATGKWKGDFGRGEGSCGESSHSGRITKSSGSHFASGVRFYPETGRSSYRNFTGLGLSITGSIHARHGPDRRCPRLRPRSTSFAANPLFFRLEDWERTIQESGNETGAA
jgi:hypothetical protein